MDLKWEGEVVMEEMELELTVDELMAMHGEDDHLLEQDTLQDKEVEEMEREHVEVGQGHEEA